MEKNLPDKDPYKFFEQERERMHRGMMSSVSHDLKTPLACIIGALEIYKRTQATLSPDKKDTLIGTALHEAYRLDSFVNNILDMARMENDAVIVKKESCLMGLLLEDCLITLGDRLAKCEISIKAIPESFSVTTDSLLLMRALCIILDNSAKYAAPHPVIGVEYTKNNHQIVIRIQDNGPGIPESKREEIFSKYARFGAQDHKYAGAGLGLPICREIMRLLGGSVTANNRTDGEKGAVFTLTLPS